MNLLIFSTMYTPDLGPSAPLYTMLCEGLVRRGHKVTIITAVPHYPSGLVPVEYRGKWKQRTFENGVEVIRIGLPSVKRTHIPQRILHILCYQLGATLVSLGLKYDAVLVGSPGLSMILPFIWSVVLRHKPAIYSVNDVYPDVGIKLGIFTNKLTISIIASLERFCLHRSAIVHIISDSFKTGMYAHGVPDKKIALIHLWVDTDLIRPLPHDNPFSEEQDLANAFVVLYAGNIGLSQGLESILDVAELLADQGDVRFVFVGDGMGRNVLQKQADRRQLTNVRFIPFQPRERLPEVLASADISLVILRKGIGINSLPSKTFSIMASSRPMIVSVDQESEMNKLMKRAEAGVWVPPEEPYKLAEAILNLKRDKLLRDRLGTNGRAWVEQNHSPQIAAEQFERLFQTVISSM